MNHDWIEKERAAAKDFCELKHACDNFLIQKSKAHWMSDGDSNSKYFHSIIKGRPNKVIRICHGKVCSDLDHIQTAFLDFYKALLGASVQCSPVNTIVVQMGPQCTHDHRQMLMAPVSACEVKEAIFSIPNHKAPGPDGYSSAFFKDAWSIIGKDVTNAVLDFFAIGKLLKQVNHTLITLIPKCDMPTTVSQFRPIACCSVLYKSISKILCSRLSQVLPDIISPNQGGFIKGRQIVENIMICQDIIRLYNRATVSPRCLLKIDLKKAYDSVEWSFIKQMMYALNFPPPFINLVMECVQSPSYSLVLNGSLFGYFNGAKGLRQGDPMSPLLSTLAMEYLTRILNYITSELPFTHHALCKQLKLTHLMFADDLLLFSKGDPRSIMVLLRGFATFSRASVLKMNPSKYNAYFNGVAASVKNDILKVSGIVEGKLPFRYLGVPITAGRITKIDAMLLVENIVSRVRSFGARKLSYAGRLTLVNYVLTALYSYWATIFIIPKGVLNRVDAVCRNYLWSGAVDYHKAPYVSWDKVCSPKREGGLGIKKSHWWNFAAVGKFASWIYNKADILWVKWVNQVYLKGADWVSYVPHGDTSWNWRMICKIRDHIATVGGQSAWADYKIKKIYHLLREKNPVVPWHLQVWDCSGIPKHNFLYWLLVRQALPVKHKLFKWGVADDEICCLCGIGAETVMHLMVYCPFSKRVIEGLALRMGVRVPESDLVIWSNNVQMQNSKKRAMECVFKACYYSIWQQRNKSRLLLSVISPKILIEKILNPASLRISILTHRRNVDIGVFWLQPV